MSNYEKIQKFSDNEIVEILNNPKEYEDDIVIEAMQIGFERVIITANQENLCNSHLKRNEIKIKMVKSFNQEKKNILTSNDELEKSLLEKANNTLALGIIALLLGLMITIVTYISASQQGGRYLVTFGVIAFGIGYIIKGFVYRIKVRESFKNKK
jgi:hypothetical protein